MFFCTVTFFVFTAVASPLIFLFLLVYSRLIMVHTFNHPYNDLCISVSCLLAIFCLYLPTVILV
jgi:hypothetical protein